ncbi:MAG: SsrA-binding protein SmpB [Eubacteriales bacterium]|nr:SsrA-binding protein SmpB [Eubacteriales bacterium]
MAKEKSDVKIAAQNKKAFHDYFVDETYEAGIALSGTEVKSIRAGTVNMKDAFCHVENGQMIMYGVHISPYEKGNVFNKDPLRARTLLMHKKEIMKLFGLCGKEGFTLVPLKMYFSGSKVKVEVGLCRGKKNFDKRDAEAKRQANRDIERTLSERNKY